MAKMSITERTEK